jgi:NADP-dependent 3-hydroxy acid dehydrogenase YdfG
MSSTWFITGASKGFGREWAEAALEREDNVAATARNLETLEAFVDTYGDAVLPIQLDVTDREADFEAVGKAASHFGKLDVVINNRVQLVVLAYQTGLLEADAGRPGSHD